jgi:ribonuclease H2 subunit C
VQILEEVSTFEDIFVWGHDAVPTNEDPFVKGIEEWISFAESLHGTPSKDKGEANVNATEKKAN